MRSSELQKLMNTGYLSGGSMAYVDALYEDFLHDPNSVPKDWQAVFKALPSVNGHAEDVAHRDIRQYFQDNASKIKPTFQTVDTAVSMKQAQVADLVNAYRAHGHHLANLDPLQMATRLKIESLSLSYHGLSDNDLHTAYHVSDAISKTPILLKDILSILKSTYCGSIGIEYMHISNDEERRWLQMRMESVRGLPAFTADEKKAILNGLIEADGLEKYLGTKYVGQKRFSLEGGDALIPMMQKIVNASGENNVKEVIIGMAHRGRLNVLVNILGKAPKQLFEEFEGKIAKDRTGDVKYHMGFSSDVKTDKGEVVHLALAFNPSHLEIIGPVVEGSVRSRLRRRHDLDDKTSVLPLLIHGDAAFAGQGVVMETFNFSQARGYATGGTLHIVINNQIGFTTSNPLDSRSTLYCTDIAKMVQAPIIHVNGDDPEAVVFATQLAFDFRKTFHRDVVLDLVCYRRHGHNEADEPSITQPSMYKKIKSMPTPREVYADKLVKEGVLEQANLQMLWDAYRAKLDKGEAVVQLHQTDYSGKISMDWTPYLHSVWQTPAKTAITQKSLLALNEKLQHLPNGYTLHSVVKKLMDDRDKMAKGELPLNWGFAETMAYASLLEEGYAVRLSGQDCGRGTFSHRHAVLHDINNGQCVIPLESISKETNKPFVVIDSVLSEEAVLAFEYGYASSEPNSLVLWEAQFGDFANGAQVVIDQFISSGEQKWGRLCGLVMLLPHGYEGQGPEHSSARLERYMQLCAQHNMQVCTPTTPSQIFHLLRRQMIRPYRKPLIVMTPKSLLRHKLAISSVDDLTKGEFLHVIPEVDPISPSKVKRIVVCCGKVYYDLLQKRRDENRDDIAIIRIEQLYPFPSDAFKAAIAMYKQAKTVVWCQEEPQNQGVWFSSQHNLVANISDNQHLVYAGRGFAASPAVGSAIVHAEEQQALVNQALFE